MSAVSTVVPLETTLRVRDTCLCLHAQRAARALAARFDAALRPVGLTNSQFSLLNAVNGPQPKTPAELASVIGADRTTVTAALKPLVRQGLAEIAPDLKDRRVRRVVLTARGHARLAAAIPLWVDAHDALEAELAGVDLGRVRHDLSALSAARPRAPADRPGATSLSPARVGQP